ncbi:uncharacterized protein BDW47DRAFT_57549 [Aspergillus candidus]|uniref:HNH nuclease domain-containing protein n=1 Tax=Aspergillus candidus TaxID=41067 RepID=A0A2I2F5L2_ASPCN|nr:hypothetical protein BDW47DRAFT_57549 [Aspergillus candidus]PLB35932.1 hypothetical protein BDW47DRAFT_57549 [Aspergillus candidus]
MSDTSSSQPRSHAFSAATRLEVQRLSGNACWACGTLSPQIAHVIGNEDGQIPLWSDMSLLNFSLTSADNGIPLCPTCHVEFDRSEDPGFIFLPVDIPFFIEFELKDRERRAVAEKDGKILRREVPTNIMYVDHLIRQRRLPEGSTGGGLYRPIFLRPYLLGGRVSPEDFGLLQTKQWHGAPMASLRRGILALGSGRICTVDETTVEDLQRLRDLYFREQSSRPCLTNTSLNVPPRKRKANDREEGSPSKRGGINDSQARASDSMDICSEHWTLGPHYTSHQACERYAYILAHD